MDIDPPRTTLGGIFVDVWERGRRIPPGIRIGKSDMDRVLLPQIAKLDILPSPDSSRGLHKIKMVVTSPRESTMHIRQLEDEYSPKIIKTLTDFLPIINHSGEDDTATFLSTTLQSFVKTRCIQGIECDTISMVFYPFSVNIWRATDVTTKSPKKVKIEPCQLKEGDTVIVLGEFKGYKINPASIDPVMDIVNIVVMP